MPVIDTAAQTDTPLLGYTVGVTAARRAEEFATLLARRGANVLRAPAIRIIPLADDTQLERVTHDIIADPPRIVVATTGIGFRGWMAAAEGWGVAEKLAATLDGARLLARGPKTKGAIRAAGLREEWSPESESSAEVLEHLLAEGVDGARIGVQLHGATSEWEPVPDFCEALRLAGAEVVPVPVYRWTPPADIAPLDKLIETAIAGGLDCLSFTSAPAVMSLFTRAKNTGRLDALKHALRRDAHVACVGSVTAAPLAELEIPWSMPERSRLGALARHIADELPRRERILQAGGHAISVRGACVIVDGELKTPPPAALSLLRVLAGRPGRVVSRADLLAALPGGSGDTHAVETTIARLRSSLGAPKVVQTVVKRGYRLALELAECEHETL